MKPKTNKQSSRINIRFVAYRPTVTENDVDDLVQFIVVVAQEGFKALKVA